MKKIINRLIIAILVLSNIILLYNNYDLKKEVLSYKENYKINKKNMISMMLETDTNSKTYIQSTDSSWPSEGYTFNEKLSKCEQGSKLSWDDTNKKVVMEGNSSDKCYVFFDIYVPKATLADYIKTQYTGTQGSNGLYYHDASLTNGAGDNSYRYAGANPNNYICFGIDKTTCPSDYLYRIIGVFNENNHGITGNQLVKIVKVNSYGTFKWDENYKSDWSVSTLNNELNTNYLKEYLIDYESKVASVSWKISGTNSNTVTPKVFYDAEITNATNTYQGKIGLIYASDYAYAADSSYWATTLNSYHTNAYKTDWLYLSSNTFWTMSIVSGMTNAWYVDSGGEVDGPYGSVSGHSYDTHPTFYLSSDTIYVSGTGTLTDPYRIG